MSWMGLVNLTKKSYCLLLNEFYSGILIHADEYENPVRFRYDGLYTFFDGKERILNESDLGKLHRCERYIGPHEAPDHYPSDNVWDTLLRQCDTKKIASDLKSIPFRFLHHFIASTI